MTFHPEKENKYSKPVLLNKYIATLSELVIICTIDCASATVMFHSVASYGGEKKRKLKKSFPHNVSA